MSTHIICSTIEWGIYNSTNFILKSSGFEFFEKLYGLDRASYPSYKMCMTEENNRKETIQVFLMTRTKFLWALKFTAEKFMPKNLKKNQRSQAFLLSLFFV